MQETELKLELSRPGAAQVLEKNPFGAAPTVLKQESVYFDTLDWDLAKRGVSLRIRQSGKKRIQTVKASDGAAAGLFTRGEWERPVTGDTPVLDDPEINPLLAGIDRTLVPLFVVHVERHRWKVTEGDGTVEVALDIGKVVAADREAPFCEIEFERKAGSAAALFALARKIDLIEPARLGVLSKAERGYRLLGPASGAVKATPAPLDADMTAITVFVRIAASCLRQFRLNEMALTRSHNAEVLHQARVSLRRLRSLFSICKPLFRDARFDRLREELRWLAGELGNARGIDVLIERSTNEVLSRRLHAARDDAYGAAEAALSSTRARAAIIDVAEWIAAAAPAAVLPDDSMHVLPAKDFASDVLDRLWKKVAKGGKGLIDADDETRHRLRITAKKLRYAAEFFKPLYDRKTEDKRYRHFLKAMERLQDRLGSLNDLATAPAMLSALGLSDLPAAKDLFGAGDRTKLLSDAAKAHDTFVETKRFW
jgi:triphosphatase